MDRVFFSQVKDNNYSESGSGVEMFLQNGGCSTSENEHMQ